MTLECTIKLHYRGPRLAREYKCRLSLGSSAQLGGAFIGVEGFACPRRKFRVSIFYGKFVCLESAFTIKCITNQKQG